MDNDFRNGPSRRLFNFSVMAKSLSETSIDHLTHLNILSSVMSETTVTDFQSYIRQFPCCCVEANKTCDFYFFDIFFVIMTAFFQTLDMDSWKHELSYHKSEFRRHFSIEFY